MCPSRFVCLFSLILFETLQKGSCYNCFACIGISKDIALEKPLDEMRITSDCIDPINRANMAKMDCSAPGSVCVKGVTEVSEDLKMMMRACMPLGECRSLTKECYTCEGDYCNTASTIIPSLTILSFISLLIRKFLL